MLQLVNTWREFKEFLEAKKRKREPLRWNATGAACAKYEPRHAQGFANFRAALRGVGDFGRASEQLDKLEHALQRRHQVDLPLPRKVMQNDDRSLSLFWEGVTVRCFPDGIASLIGGTSGVPEKKITRALLDMLAFQVRIQAVS